MPDRPVALITGGARRVGRAIAIKLAGAGYDIAITYHRSRGEAESLVGELRAGGVGAVAIAADLTDPEVFVPQIAVAMRGGFGRLDVLVNNASLYLAGGLRDAQAEAGRKMWAIHVTAPLLICRAFEPQLRASASGGRVINMVDILAERPMASHAMYCASKAGLLNLTYSLAKELAPDATVNAISPGVVEWPDGYPREEKVKYLRRVPLGRAGTPDDAAGAVLFLCGEGSYVTGQVVRVDGGRSLI